MTDSTLLDKLDDTTVADVDSTTTSAPAAKPATVLDRIESPDFLAKVADAAPRTVDPTTFIRHAIATVRQNDQLMKVARGGTGVDSASIPVGIMRAAALGLDLDPALGQAYLVPRKDKAKGLTAVFQVGYRGLLELAMRSGKIKRIEVERVHDNDHFRAEKGSTSVLEFRPDWFSDRGPLLGWYALAELDNGVTQWVVIGLDEMEEHRDKYAPRSNGAVTGPWKNFFEEMGDKTAFLRLARWLPKSVEMVNALEGDLDAAVVGAAEMIQVDDDVIDIDDAEVEQ